MGSTAIHVYDAQDRATAAAAACFRLPGAAQFGVRAVTLTLFFLSLFSKTTLEAAKHLRRWEFGPLVGAGWAPVVWDGAPSHRDRRMGGLGLPLIELPPYSPPRFGIGAAERVIEEMRRWIEGRMYNSIEDKVEAVEAFLSKLESDPHQVRALTCWDWIDEAIQRLPVRLAA